jgi:L-threonylcarbamoyladenylate synthase
MPAPILAPTDAAIAAAARALAKGELVGFPTETVYGLGADAANADAVRRVFAAKGRPADHPLIVHLAAAGQIDRWAIDVPAPARALAARFWPGPLTLVLTRAPGVPDGVTGGQASVGLRVPSHPVAQRLLVAFGGGVAAPSANRFGRVSPTTAEHVAAELGDSVALILDGGACEVGIESTIVDFTSAGGRAVVLRPGGIPASRLAQVLGYAPLAPARNAPRASGTLASHYAPATRTVVVPAADLDATVTDAGARGRVGVLTLAPHEFAREPDARLAGGTRPDAYARALYRALRTLDAAGLDLIVVEAPPAGDAWLAVNDRLRRASFRDAP